MSAAPRHHAPHTTADAVAGLRRRLIERVQAEIDVARATGDHHQAELLALKLHDYPAWVAAQARESAAAVAGLPLCERLSSYSE